MQTKMNKDEILALPYRPCVGIMICNHDGGVFAGQRLDSTSDAWQMPQGGIEKGEKPKVAALRELEEETGIPEYAVQIVTETSDWVTYDLPHKLVPELWKGRYRGQKQKWFLMRFTGDEALININTKVPEFSAWAWLPPEKLLNLIVPFKRDVYQHVLREFQTKTK
jgi:putative (di)nucleoside polyphosphate hydrolase